VRVGTVSSSSSSSSVGTRLARGDEYALEECYRLYGPMVRGYLRHFVPDEEADDLLQIVFLEVWRCRDRLDTSRPFEAWLFGIARKRAIDQLRRRHHEVVSVDAIRELSGEDGDEFVERLAWAAEVRTALTQLSADQQEAIELSYFGDLTQQQIAAKLDVPIGTVKARMARGMRRLAALVDGGELT
jgi:RNA polymerase sigma-70 factor (ECF subfamily)